MSQTTEVARIVKPAALALQVLFLACSYMPGAQQPAKGALVLISLFFCGVCIGAGVSARSADST